MSVGFDIFSSKSSCQVNGNTVAPSVVTLDTCTIVNNVASQNGGGINVQDGIFTLQAWAFIAVLAVKVVATDT